MKRLLKQILLLIIMCSMQSCALLRKKGSWGKDAFYPIKGERFLEAIKKNGFSAHVWGPVVGAGIFTAFNFDRNFSNWVQNEGNIFKNQDAADAWSDNFNNILKYQHFFHRSLNISAQLSRLSCGD